MGTVISGICDVTLCICLYVRAVKEKRLELSKLNLAEVRCMAVARHALTLKSKDQGHAVIKCVDGVGMQVGITA